MCLHVICLDVHVSVCVMFGFSCVCMCYVWLFVCLHALFPDDCVSACGMCVCVMFLCSCLDIRVSACVMFGCSCVCMFYV